MQAYTVIASHRYGRFGTEQRWFRTKNEAIVYADDLVARSQIGRSTRLGPGKTANLRFYVVKAEAIVQMPAQRITTRPLSRQDVAGMFMYPTRS